MIPVDRWQIRDTVTGLYLDVGFAPGHGQHDCWKEDMDACTSWGFNGATLRMEQRQAQYPSLEIVRANGCKCCGIVYGAKRYRWRGITYYLCEKHLGREPCLVEGCRRTFAADRHDMTFICGKHWRQAPKYMRDAVSRVRRIIKKRGATDELYARHDRLFNRTVRAIVDGQNLDMAEIERMFGL